MIIKYLYFGVYMLTFGYVLKNTEQLPEFELFRESHQHEQEDTLVSRSALVMLINLMVTHIQNNRVQTHSQIASSAFSPSLLELRAHLRQQLPPPRPLSEFTYDISRLVDLIGRSLIIDALELKSRNIDLIKLFRHCVESACMYSVVAGMKKLLAANIFEQEFFDLMYKYPKYAESIATLRVKLTVSNILSYPCESFAQIQLRQNLCVFLSKPINQAGLLNYLLTKLPRLGIDINTNNFHKLCQHNKFYSDLVEYTEYLATGQQLPFVQVHQLVQVIMRELSDIPEQYDNRIHILDFLTKSKVNTMDVPPADREVAIISPVERIMSFIRFISKYKQHLELLSQIVGHQIYIIQRGFAHYGGIHVINRELFILIGQLLPKRSNDDKANCALNFVNALYGEENCPDKGFLRVHLGTRDFGTKEAYATSENICFLAHKSLEFSPTTLIADILKRLFILNRSQNPYVAVHFQEGMRRTLEQVVAREMAEQLLQILIHTQEILNFPEYEKAEDVFKRRAHYLSEIVVCLKNSKEFYSKLCQLAEHRQLTKSVLKDLIKQYKPTIFENLRHTLLGNSAVENNPEVWQQASAVI